ncbi:MAG: exopolysaccharide synthesis protein, partial [Gammaproteobacteria bacterium]|nr:exopolysaccharide synthesis protein [Gammaproteobacteria bacterium]
ECTLDEAAITNWGKHVDVLPAGKLSCSPHRLLGNGAFYKLIDSLRQRYHFVVIDTPPVLAASESVVLNRAADGFLLCSMRDVSRLDQIVETRDRLMAAGATPVGTVLNGVPTRQYGYRYGRYSYALQ